ncbi:tyrosine-type recombinase/integrase [Viridibacillus sp. NPDC096237]|uniref:tyrosine-type recombinase/integrase n=1 Tax=Viridibacillus sp. NPDC096237 TaxID=3390721 RepID=UPI003CFF3D51
MASFRKVGQYWQYRVRYRTDVGEWKEISKCGFKTKKAAQEHARQREMLDTTEIDGSRMNLGTYLMQWLEIYVVDKRKLNTVKTYRHVLEKHIIPELGMMQLGEIKPMRYQNFLDSVIERGFSPETARRVHTPFRMAMEQAVVNGYISKNPASHAKITKKTVKKLKFLQPELIPEVLEFLYERSYGLGIYFEALFESGMRKGECSGIELDDINWNDNTIRIDDSYNYNATKAEKKMDGVKTSASERTIVMREDYMKKLKTYVKYRMEKRTLIGALYNTDNNFVFGRDDGTPFPKSTLYNAYKAAMEHISHELLPIHSTRHTHAVMFLEAGVTMKEVQERLGHGSIQITSDIYSHVTRKMENKSIEKFDEYMQKKSAK